MRSPVSSLIKDYKVSGVPKEFGSRKGQSSPHVDRTPMSTQKQEIHDEKEPIG